MNEIQTQLADLYLEWLNDYITVAKFAEHKGISEVLANMIVNEGREWHEYRATGTISDRLAELCPHM